MRPHNQRLGHITKHEQNTRYEDEYSFVNNERDIVCGFAKTMCSSLNSLKKNYLLAQFKKNKCGFVLLPQPKAKQKIRTKLYQHKMHKEIQMKTKQIKHRFTNADNKMFRL